MLSSLRFRLIAFFALLLTGVVYLFGSLAYESQERATWARIDGELQSQAQAVAAALEFDQEERHVKQGEGDEHVLGGGWELDLSSEFRDRIASQGWFVVLVSHGDGSRSLIHSEGKVPKTFAVAGTPYIVTDPDAPRIHNTWHARQITHHERVEGRSVTILVSRRTGSMQAILIGQKFELVLMGLGVLALGLLGAVFIARLSVKPIEAAAAQAAAISEDDLSARLATDSIPSELQGVVQSFNGTLDRLQAAFERQAQFTADASHELRTPVAIIRTQAEAALKRDRSAEDYKSSLEACARAAVRMTAIVEGLLTLARADGGAQLPHAACDLKAVVDEAVAPLAEQAAANGMTVACEAAPATVKGDEGLLGEVVTNLVTNAIRYNKPGGSVNVTLTVPNGAVELRVRDTGSGIPADSLPHLFERFYRVDPARSREQGGSGLGLAITKWIVEAHQGAIAVESTEGEGTTFTVTLPTG